MHVCNCAERQNTDADGRGAGRAAKARLLWCWRQGRDGALPSGLLHHHQPGEATYRERLEELLRALEAWAAGGAAAPARPERPATVMELESAIQLFLKNLGRPVLYTVDEVRD